MKLKAGDLVEVRSENEILKTLNRDGRLEGLPFMPEMFKYCGHRFTVFKRAHKTCGPIDNCYVPRGLTETVHLNLRCSGTAHDGCRANCLIFWKEKWLKKVGKNFKLDQIACGEVSQSSIPTKSSCTKECVLRGAKKITVDGETQYVCQATELAVFTTPLKWWDARQYVEDYSSNNATLGQILRTLSFTAYCVGTFANKPRLGRPARFLYDIFQQVVGGVPFPKRVGTIGAGQSTPRVDLNLQPGDLVRVKDYKDILSTIDEKRANRGLLFDAEMVPYCGKTFRVLSRVDRFIDEETGKMRTLKTPAIILESVYCKSRYSGKRVLCPRGYCSWWREIWLERVPEGSTARPSENQSKCGERIQHSTEPIVCEGRG